MAGITFSVNAPFAIMNKFSILPGGKIQTEIDREVLKRLPPYVPKNTGALIESAEKSTIIGSGKIRYTCDYSSLQYYGVSKSGRPLNYTGGGMRGSYWFLRMKETEGKSILNKVGNTLGVRVKVNSGASKTSKTHIKTTPIKTVIGNRHLPVF